MNRSSSLSQPPPRRIVDVLGIKFIFRTIEILALGFWLFIRVLGLNLLTLLNIRSRTWKLDRIGKMMLAVFQTLSGTFIKFGQLLAMREDLLPPEITGRLQSLLDDVPPEPFENDKRQILRELRIGSIEEVFEGFEPQPLAAASFATVYKARFKGGETGVVIKVQRSGLYYSVRRDIAIVKMLARIIDFSGAFRRIRVVKIVDEFRNWTINELDYEREGQQMEFFRKLHGDNSGICIPRLYWEYSTGRVLVMEQLKGIWVSEILAEQRKLGAVKMVTAADRLRAAHIVFQAFMTEIFEAGFFHADPHAGNICLLPDGRVGIIDFGLVGMLSKRDQEIQLELIYSVQNGDSDVAFKAITKMLNVPPDGQVAEFRRQFEENVRAWVLQGYEPEAHRAKRTAGALMLANFAAARECGLSLSSGVAAYYRGFIVMDAVLNELSQEFSTLDETIFYLEDRFIRTRLKTLADLLKSRGMEFHMRLAQTAEKLSHALQKGIEYLENVGDLVETSFSKFRSRLSQFVNGVANLLIGAGVIGGLVWVATLFIAVKQSKVVEKNNPVLKYIPLHTLSLDLMLIGLIAGAIAHWIGVRFWIGAYKEK
jgi:ubiquinone biosynthesis protein